MLEKRLSRIELSVDAMFTGLKASTKTVMFAQIIIVGSDILRNMTSYQ